MSKKFRNPVTGETFILEEEPESTESKKSEAEEGTGENTEKGSFGEFRTPFNILDEINGKDLEKVMLGAALGIGGMLAINGLCSFLRRV